MAITKRTLIELIEHVPEDTQLSFVALHDMEQGDILTHVSVYDPDHLNSDCVYLAVGDPVNMEEDE